MRKQPLVLDGGGERIRAGGRLLVGGRANVSVGRPAVGVRAGLKASFPRTVGASERGRIVAAKLVQRGYGC